MISKTLLRGILAVIAVLWLGAGESRALPAPTPPETDEMSLTISENINTPEIPKRRKAAVAAAMAAEGRALAGKGYSVKTLRDGEVLMLTIPCSELFAANSIELKPGAAKLLSPLSSYAAASGVYKLLVAVHSDDTGDDLYCDRLTADRANAIDAFFEKSGPKGASAVIPYGLGRDEPAGSNASIELRRKNRRVEIYIVPAAGYLKKLSGQK